MPPNMLGPLPTFGRTDDHALSIPKASEVQFEMAGKLDKPALEKLAQVYDELRSDLQAAEIDPRVQLSVLSVFVKGGLIGLKTEDELADFEMYTPRLSLSQQRCMTDRLEQVFQKYAAAWVQPSDPRTDLLIEDAGPLTPERLVNRTVTAAITRMWRVMRTKTAVPDKCLGNDGEWLAGGARWMNPIRINSSGSPSLDNAIRLALDELKADVPKLPIDSATFPAPDTQVNFWVGREKDYSVLSLLRLCNDHKRCAAVGDLFANGVKKTTRRDQPMLLREAYLARPYFQGLFGSVLVRQDRTGAIIQAGCGSIDLGFGGSSVQITAGTVRRNAVFLCLAQALGATPSGSADLSDIQVDIKQTAIRQLRKLYSKGT